MVKVIVRGTGDVASAVAHALYGAGCCVALHDVANAAHTRRGMAFVDALYEGKAQLSGVFAKHARVVDALRAMMECRKAIPASSESLEHVLAAFTARAYEAGIEEAPKRPLRSLATCATYVGFPRTPCVRCKQAALA